MSTTPCRVLIVDDSAVVRQSVRQILEREPGIEVIGAASDPVFALGHMQRQWPDVIVLDIEMPRMDGLTFLKKIMSERPTPVMSFSASAACMLPTMPTMGANTPMVEQATSSNCASGGNRQA